MGEKVKHTVPKEFGEKSGCRNSAKANGFLRRRGFFARPITEFVLTWFRVAGIYRDKDESCFSEGFSLRGSFQPWLCRSQGVKSLVPQPATHNLLGQHYMLADVERDEFAALRAEDSLPDRLFDARAGSVRLSTAAGFWGNDSRVCPIIAIEYPTSWLSSRCNAGSDNLRCSLWIKCCSRD